jgi:adenylosuccinate synthase
MPNSLTIVGVQWGDEGKGKVTDLLAHDASLVVRYQGGANAGHTVVVEGRKVVLHQVPSGILNPDAFCVVGPAVVVDPDTLLSEMDTLHLSGVDVSPDRLAISRAATVVLPYHKRLDALRETARGASRIGTTGRGIGPAYEDLFGRTAIRLADLCDPDRLAARLDALLPERNAVLKFLGGEAMARDAIALPALALGARLKPFLRDTGEVVARHMSEGKNVLFESAQGTLLDVLHGTWPFVTSSLTVAPAAFALSGVGVPAHGGVLGVTKAYTTRVGSGPFPTEDLGEYGEWLRQKGGEFGATTGRPRRCGHLDLPALRYAMRVNGVTALALTKMDVLSGLSSIKVCTAWRIGDSVIDIATPDLFSEPGLQPVLEEWPGWLAPLDGATDMDALPAEARGYVDRLESALGVPVQLVSTGSGRESTVVRSDPWA